MVRLLWLLGTKLTPPLMRIHLSLVEEMLLLAKKLSLSLLIRKLSLTARMVVLLLQGVNLSLLVRQWSPLPTKISQLLLGSTSGD